MSHFVYIIHSERLDRYYIGETTDPDQRVLLHNSHAFKGASTADATDWRLLCTIECTDRSQARALEKWIKRQKSRRTINLLIADPEYRKSCLQRIQI